MAKNKIAYLMGGKTNQQDPVVETPAVETRQMIDWVYTDTGSSEFTVAFTEDVTAPGNEAGMAVTVDDVAATVGFVSAIATAIVYSSSIQFLVGQTALYSYTAGNIVAVSDGAQQSTTNGTITIVDIG